MRYFYITIYILQYKSIKCNKKMQEMQTFFCSFNLPNLTGYAIPRGVDTNIGGSDDGALPNITGTFVAYVKNYSSTDGLSTSGAFSDTKRGSNSGVGGSNCSNFLYTFNAHNSNSMYGTSPIVKPKGVNMMYAIKY